MTSPGSRCARCGRDNREGARFCDQCGAPLDEGVRWPEAEHPAVALEGERKQVTVMFADVRGSLELLADIDPEAAQRLLDPIVTLMMSAVHEHEGVVNQVLGDGIMALFGAPAAYEDHAVRACHAALAMQRAMTGHAASHAAGPALRIRIGINSGEVVVRALGTDRGLDYSAVGLTTHVASRLEQLARPGSTLISPSTRRLADRYVTATSLGPQPIRGLREPLEVFELVGAGPTRAPWQATRERWRTAFVGREAELAVLGAAAAAAAGGRGQLVTVVGEPGVGKSRLVAELLRRELGEAWTVLETGTVAYGRSRTYGPIVHLLRACLEAGEGMDAAAATAAVARRRRELDLPATDEPALRALLALPDADPEWDGLDPVQRRRRTFEAVARVARAHARARPLCLVVEDVHWIDPESEALLGHVLAATADTRTLVIVTARPEYESPWRTRPEHRLLTLKPMAASAAAALLGGLLGDDPGLEGVKATLVARTGGNPFFLEESVRNLVETRALTGGPGGYAPAKGVALDEVPASVEAVVAARIDRLRPHQKALLQCAAMIGASVPFALVEAVAGLPADLVQQGIRDLEALDLFFHEVTAGELRYRFKHALTVDVARASILSDRRRAVDAQVVEASERLGMDHTIEQVEGLAQHAYRGELWGKAAQYGRAAGLNAFARSAYRAAVEHLDRALECLARLPETAETLAQAIDARLDLRSALIPLGDLDRIMETLREAEALALRAGDRRRLGRVSSFQTVLFHLLGSLDRAVEHGERALAIARELDDRPIRIVANAYLGLTCHTAGAYARALALARENVRLLDGAGWLERFGMTLLPSVYSRTCLVWCLAERGEFGEAAAVAEQALALAEAAAHPYSRVYAHLGAGVLHARRTDLDAAIAALESALAICRGSEIAALFATAAAPLCSAYASAGRADAALRLVDEATDVAGSIGDPVIHWLRTGSRAEALLAAGRPAEALPLALKYREQRARIGARGYQAWATLLVADAQAPLDAGAAEAACREALDLATRLEMAPLRAQCQLRLGQLLTSRGRRPEAREMLSAAAETFVRLDMRVPRDRCEAALETTSERSHP